VTSGTFGAADTGKEFDSGLVESTALISQGKIFDYTFDKVRKFNYHCMLHPVMTG
jgi:plastocyanin